MALLQRLSSASMSASCTFNAGVFFVMPIWAAQLACRLLVSRPTLSHKGKASAKIENPKGAFAAPEQAPWATAHHAHADAAPNQAVGQVAQAVVADRAHAPEPKVAVVLHQPLVPRVCRTAGVCLSARVGPLLYLSPAAQRRIVQKCIWPLYCV